MSQARQAHLETISAILSGLRPSEPPRLAFLRRASEGLAGRPGTLFCLSASFNPMTSAHVALLEAGGQLIPSQEILLLLATTNVDKGVEGLPLERRLDLLLRFADSRPEVSVAVVAHGRFVDKMEAIRDAYPPNTRLIFLLGLDTLIRLFDTKYYRDRDASVSHLFRWSECAVADRGPDALGTVEAFLSRSDVRRFVHRIHRVRLPDHFANLSATDVRARLARGQPITDLVPEELRSPLEAWWQDQRGGQSCRPGGG